MLLKKSSWILAMPVASPFEREALKIGFDVSPEAQSLVQLRPPIVPPCGDARSDTQIMFDLACRLGLGEFFWGGTSTRPIATNSAPRASRWSSCARQRAIEASGIPQGFCTPSRKVELYSQTFLEHG